MKRATLDRRAWLVWGVGVAVCLTAVLHRSSMAVAGILARERFDITAAQLATFLMLQLLVYALAQVPVGVLLDRFGTRRLLAAGLLVTMVGQLGFAFATTFAQALVFRAFVGIGDALIFISVIRLVMMWFEPHIIPLLTQVTGTMGQAGGILAAIPMTLMFANLGWTKTYVILACFSVVMLVLLVLFVHDSPTKKRLSGDSLSMSTAKQNVFEAWAHPGTRLGFWTHFTTQFSANAFMLIWGFPFMVRSEHYSDNVASGLLTVGVISAMLSGPILGTASARFAYHRSSMVLTIVSVLALIWTFVLFWPGDAPLWLLTILVISLGVAGPASLIGLDFSRAFNPGYRAGTAIGLVNQAGFFATVILIIAMGLILDWQTGGGAFTPESFTWAFSAQYVLWVIGGVQILRYRRRTRALVASQATE